MPDSLLTEMTIEDILKKWPQTAKTFSRYSSSCIGCAIAPFCKIEDAVNYYELPKDEFMDALHRAIEHKTITPDSN